MLAGRHRSDCFDGSFYSPIFNLLLSNNEFEGDDRMVGRESLSRHIIGDVGAISEF